MLKPQDKPEGRVPSLSSPPPHPAPGLWEWRLQRRTKCPLCGLLEPHQGCSCMWLGSNLLSTYYVPGSRPNKVLHTTLYPHGIPDQGELRDPSLGPRQLRILLTSGQAGQEAKGATQRPELRTEETVPDSRPNTGCSQPGPAPAVGPGASHLQHGRHGGTQGVIAAWKVGEPE